MEIRKTETPSRELLLLADEVEASVADYIGRGTCYAACDDGRRDDARGEEGDLPAAEQGGVARVIVIESHKKRGLPH